MSSRDIYKLEPFFYLHVLDQNSNVTRIEKGPQTFIRQDHERIQFGPEPMIVIPPQHFITIKNPVRVEENVVCYDKYGQVQLRHGEIEIRLTQPPFALFPGEIFVNRQISKLDLVRENHAYALRALQHFVDEDENKRCAGDEFLFQGPGLYVPNPNVEKVREIKAQTIKKGEALRLMCIQDCVDRQGVSRVAGEEWLVLEEGCYLPGIFEKIVSIEKAIVLTDRIAIHCRALRSFKDAQGNERKNGEMYLVDQTVSKSYIPSVYEEVVKNIDVTVLNSRQYCVILNPYDVEHRANKLGAKKLVVGPHNFFLFPGEILENGIEDVYVLTEEEGLILTCTERFHEKGVERKPGDRWMLQGPCNFIPPVQAKVIRKNQAIPLHKNEGIYIRDIKSGNVRLHVGSTILLNENEELYEKELPDVIESLLSVPSEFGRIPEDEMKIGKRAGKKGGGKGGGGGVAVGGGGSQRDKTRAVSYRVPSNCVVQIYDFKSKKARVEFGPSLVMLQPDELFTPLSLSGGCPKVPNQIQTLHLMLGPDFCHDMIIVETKDHAKLNIEVSYNWQFELEEEEKDTSWATKLFSISDFIGDCCSAVASRIRGSVASVSFSEFHKNSARMIRMSVFGLDSDGHVGKRFFFKANNLSITGIDIKQIEPSNRETRQALQQSVQQAISITTDAQQSLAQQEADRVQQKAKGELQRQKINDSAMVEESRKRLKELQAETKAVQTTGQARAEAMSRANASKIMGLAQVEVATLNAQAKKKKLDGDMERLNRKRAAELKYIQKKQQIETEHQEKMSKLATDKFNATMECIGKDTIKLIASSGPELQMELVKALGFKTVVVHSGRPMLNMFVGNEGSARVDHAMTRAIMEDDRKDDKEQFKGVLLSQSGTGKA